MRDFGTQLQQWSLMQELRDLMSTNQHCEAYRTVAANLTYAKHLEPKFARICRRREERGSLNDADNREFQAARYDLDELIEKASGDYGRMLKSCL